MIAFLGARATPGVEVVSDRRYARTIEIGGDVGSVAIAPGRAHLIATIKFRMSAGTRGGPRRPVSSCRSRPPP